MKIFILASFVINIVNALSFLQHTNCGVKRQILGSRIVGGRPAEKGEFPWTVSLQRLSQNEFEHFCGAAVISDRWIVTAAHCFHRKSVKGIRGVFGTVDLAKFDDETFITDFDKIVIHEDYKRVIFQNDIALLKTKKLIPIHSTNLTINAICLPKGNQNFLGRVSTSGWGRINEEDDASDSLVTVNIALYEDEDCKELYKETFYQNIMLCAGSLKGGKDACQGDSGGPLEKLVDDRVYLVGVVSFGEGCARQFRPSIYTKISSFTNWINETINKEERKQNENNERSEAKQEHTETIEDDSVDQMVVEGNHRDKCGIRKENSLYRIVGGRPALEKEFPWTVSLMKANGLHFCGAAVLSNRWIITAAHCLHKLNIKNIRGVFGTTHLKNKAKHSFTTTFEHLVQHPAFEYSGKRANDIALLKTSDIIPNYSENQSINKICLPNINTTFADAAYVSGWGSTIELGDFNDYLKVLLVRKYNDHECKLLYGEKFIPETMICAGYNQGGSDACTGDSGGPLEQLIDKKSYLIGIVSFGVGCARPNLPGVYTKLSPYVDWIQSIIGKNKIKITQTPVVRETVKSSKELKEGKQLTKVEIKEKSKQNPMFCTRLCDQLCDSLH